MTDVAFAARLGDLLSSSGAFILRSYGRAGATTSVFDFESARGNDRIEISVGPRSLPGPVFRRLAHCSIRYRGQLDGATTDRRAAAGALVVGLGAAIDAHCDGGGRLEDLGRGAAAALRFDASGVAALVAPYLRAGQEFIAGWSMSGISDLPRSTLASSESPSVGLDFARGAERVRILVSPRLAERRAWCDTAHFSLSHLNFGDGQDAAGRDLVRALASVVFQLADHAALTVTFPPTEALAAPLDRAEPGVGLPSPVLRGAMNLFIPTECNQQCQFCSIKTWEPPRDDGDTLFDLLRRDLDDGRRNGVSAVRVNGYDPLSYSRILDLLAYIRNAGYQQAAIYSPSTLLADRDFCARVVEAMPPISRFFIPLYADTFALHDEIVGRRGAHALVMRAIDNLCALAGTESVTIVSVAVRENLAALPSLAQMAHRRSLSLSVWLPYPTEPRSIHYRQTMPRYSEVADAMASSQRDGAAFVVEAMPPCVVSKRFDEAGEPITHSLLGPKPHLRGTEHRASPDLGLYVPAVVACPHRAQCAAADTCAGEFFDDYVAVHGLAEFAPLANGVGRGGIIEATAVGEGVGGLG